MTADAGTVAPRKSLSLLLRDAARRRPLAADAYTWARVILDATATADRYARVYAELAGAGAR